MIYSVINKFNLLVTGRVRCKRKGVKKDPLYNNTIKRVLIKSLSLKPQQQNAFIKKGIAKYERELKEYNILINNRKIAQQLLYILADVGEFEVDDTILKNDTIINQLKAELLTTINRTIYDTHEEGAKEFDLLYKKKKEKSINLITDLTNNFETNSKNSIFNNISVEEAYYRGTTFFREFENYHDKAEVKKQPPPLIKIKEDFVFPELDFDV